MMKFIFDPKFTMFECLVFVLTASAYAKADIGWFALFAINIIASVISVYFEPRESTAN